MLSEAHLLLPLTTQSVASPSTDVSSLICKHPAAELCWKPSISTSSCSFAYAVQSLSSKVPACMLEIGSQAISAPSE